jgi:type II secretory pathway predicted ATPase ExeA
MPVETLENLRMLSNLETSRDKLMQIVLVGQPEFEEILNRKELRQLKQRIAVHSIIAPFRRKESLAYIQHRLKKAGMNQNPIFTRAALKNREEIQRDPTGYQHPVRQCLGRRGWLSKETCQLGDRRPCDS